jgi:hypothetical protein
MNDFTISHPQTYYAYKKEGTCNTRIGGGGGLLNVQ